MSDIVAQATALKDAGNAYVKDHKYILALEKYQEALDLLGDGSCAPQLTAVINSNSAQAFIKIENYGLAIQAANTSLKLDPKYIKAYYRRGSANFALGNHKQALKDFKSVVTLCPNDKDAQSKLKACEKEVRAQAFASAIENDNRDGLNIDISTLTIDPSFQGPSLFDENSELALTEANVRETLQFLKEEKKLPKSIVLKVLVTFLNKIKEAPNVNDISIPLNEEGKPGKLTVVGDIHGQYYDLLNIFELNGYPSCGNETTSPHTYLFNGDVVDRGSFSFECIFALILFKLLYWDHLHIHRGNHETKTMNSVYGFTGEITTKYDKTVLTVFNNIFQSLPIVSILEKKVFVVHGGISTDEFSVNDIRVLNRFAEPAQNGLLHDLLWADPHALPGKHPSKRGLGFEFGPDYTDKFLKKENLELIIRSHELKQNGYQWDHNQKCLTIFSAPNYCDEADNKGAIVNFTNPEDMTPDIVTFESAPHPKIPSMYYANKTFSF